MPEVRRIELPERSTVQAVLKNSAQDLIPEELADNELVRWVVDFSNPFLETQTDKELDRYRGEDSWRAEFIGRMVSSFVQPKVQFYFASLFHIGRMMVTATESMDRMNRLTTEENLESSAIAIRQITGRGSVTGRPRDLGFVRSSLMESCEIGLRYQSEQRGLATVWWREWRDEVQLFRSAVRDCQEDFQRYRNKELRAGSVRGLIRLWSSYSSGRLQNQMQHAGVKFKNTEFHSDELQSSPLSSLPMFAMIALLDEDDGSRRCHHMEYLMHKFINTDRNRVEHQRSEIALRILDEKHRNRSPFDHWVIGKSPATPELRMAMLEHKLPNGMDSPWLQSWRNTLTPLNSYGSILPVPNGHDSTYEQWCVVTSDSAIKGNITDSDYNKMPWGWFVQGCFENRWVLEIVKMAVYTNGQRSDPSATWDAASVSDLVAKTVRALNSMGYTLENVAFHRIESLMKRIASGEDVYAFSTW